MIPTLLLDVPTTFFLGSLVALAAAPQIRAGADPFGKYFRLAAGYALWFGLVVGYPFFRYPDWMFVYLRDPHVYSLPAVYAIFVSALVLGAISGEMLTQALLARGRTALAVLVFCWGFLVYAALFYATRYEYVHFGSYTEYLAGRLPHLRDVPGARWALNATGVLLVLPGAGLAAYLLRERRQTR